VNSTPITIKPGEIPLDYQYQTSRGNFTRRDLIERHAPTIQNCLAISGVDYSSHKAAEMIMRVVIGLIKPKGPRRSSEYIVNKLQNGLSSLGYAATPGTYDTAPQSVIPGLHVMGEFPAQICETFQDFISGEVIGLDGVLEYTEILQKCLIKTNHVSCDKVAFNLVKAVGLLIDDHPNDRLAQIELLLWKAMQDLGYYLDVAPWYQTKLLKRE